MSERELKRRLMYAMEIYGESLTFNGYTISRDPSGLCVHDHATRRVYHFNQPKYERKLEGTLALVLRDDATYATRIETLPSWDMSEAS